MTLLEANQRMTMRPAQRDELKTLVGAGQCCLIHRSAPLVKNCRGYLDLPQILDAQAAKNEPISGKKPGLEWPAVTHTGSCHQGGREWK